MDFLYHSPFLWDSDLPILDLRHDTASRRLDPFSGRGRESAVVKPKSQHPFSCVARKPCTAVNIAEYR